MEVITTFDAAWFSKVEFMLTQRWRGIDAKKYSVTIIRNYSSVIFLNNKVGLRGGAIHSDDNCDIHLEVKYP